MQTLLTHLLIGLVVPKQGSILKSLRILVAREPALVEFLLHFVIPFSALSLGGASLRKTLFACSISLLPDLDFLVNVHRSMTHSAAVLAVVMLPALILFWRTKYRVYVVLAAAGLLSHLALDIFGDYVPILWPLYNQSVHLVVRSAAHTGSGLKISFSAEMLTQPISFEPLAALDASIFTSEGLIASTLLLCPILMKKLAPKAQR